MINLDDLYDQIVEYAKADNREKAIDLLEQIHSDGMEIGRDF